MAKSLAEYKDQFTLDGRLKPQPGVSKGKSAFMRELVKKTMDGDRAAKGLLESAVTSSDAIFNFAHVLNIQLLPQFDKLTPTWKQIAGTRTVQDFRPAILYSLLSQWSDVEHQGADPDNVAPNGIAPVVPEGSVYPYAYMSGQEAKTGGIRKRGFKTDFTFEAFINDSIGFISQLPENMLAVAEDTPDYDVYNVLTTGVPTGSKLLAGTNPDGTSIPVNAPLSRAALIQALYQLSQRKVNNRYVQVNGGYNLLVPIGQRPFIEFWLNQAIAEVQDGSLTLTVTGYNPLASVTVIESEWITGTNWYLLPKPGATRRPIIDYAYLAGHTDPELRVENATGSYIGGGAVSPFEGSFSNDSATFRMRLIGGPILWSPELVVWSNGTSA